MLLNTLCILFASLLQRAYYFLFFIPQRRNYLFCYLHIYNTFQFKHFRTIYCIESGQPIQQCRQTHRLQRNNSAHDEISLAYTIAPSFSLLLVFCVSDNTKRVILPTARANNTMSLFTTRRGVASLVI